MLVNSLPRRYRRGGPPTRRPAGEYIALVFRCFRKSQLGHRPPSHHPNKDNPAWWSAGNLKYAGEFITATSRSDAPGAQNASLSNAAASRELAHLGQVVR